MYIGQYLPVTPASSPQDELFSPWFPREADGAYFTVQVIQKEDVSPEPELVVRVFNRAKDDTGSGTEVPSTWTAEDSNGFMTCNLQVDSGSPEFPGFLEMVRLSFCAVNGSLIYRVLPPSWFNKG